VLHTDTRQGDNSKRSTKLHRHNLMKTNVWCVVTGNFCSSLSLCCKLGILAVVTNRRSSFLILNTSQGPTVTSTKSHDAQTLTLFYRLPPVSAPSGWCTWPWLAQPRAQSATPLAHCGQTALELVSCRRVLEAQVLTLAYRATRSELVEYSSSGDRLHLRIRVGATASGHIRVGPAGPLSISI
jgi:hypothetical protein